jgi:endoglucanase
MQHRRPPRRLVRRLVAALALLPLIVPTALAAGASTPEPALRTGDNPLAGRPWGVYKGPLDQAWPPYARATGETKDLLGRIALTPKAKWFGSWVPNGDIARKVRDYIASSTAGDPETLVQMAIFRMVPWENQACRRLPTKAERASYKDWIRRFASAVGTTHTAIVLQPDGPFALCAPGGSAAPSRLIAYSARVLAALPNTSVYIDVGAADWPAPGRGGVDAVIKFLLPAGIEHARGVALNSTHYSATEAEVARGAAIVQALEARGLTGQRVVVNTSSNGRPFEFGRYDGPDPENARVCRSPDDPRLCVTLGIPPTADVANPAWGLPAETNQLAAQYVDGYLWFGRPWLYKQADPFVTKRALALVRSTPY